MSRTPKWLKPRSPRGFVAAGRCAIGSRRAGSRSSPACSQLDRNQSGLPDAGGKAMIRTVLKLEIACLAISACLAACTGERATSSPADEPEGVELELDEEETEAMEEESADEGPAEEEVAEEESAEAEPATPEEPPPPKKTCAELSESTCKVTVGCVWSTDKKCLDE